MPLSSMSPGSYALGAARIGTTGAVLLAATTEELAESLGHLGMLFEELLGLLTSHVGTSLLLGVQHDNRRQNPLGDRAEDVRQFGDGGCMGYGRGCGGGLGLRLNGCLLSETDGGHQSDSADQRDQPGCTVAKQCHGETPFGIETGFSQLVGVNRVVAGSRVSSRVSSRVCSQYKGIRLHPPDALAAR
jgi:hypothetical protein